MKGGWGNREGGRGKELNRELGREGRTWRKEGTWMEEGAGGREDGLWRKKGRVWSVVDGGRDLEGRRDLGGGIWGWRGRS